VVPGVSAAVATAAGLGRALAVGVTTLLGGLMFDIAVLFAAHSAST